MGDLRVCSSHDSDVMEDRLNFPATLFSPTPDPSLISDEAWSVAEGTTHDVVLCIHPTLDSEEKRKDVIDYIQRLIRGSLGCEVFPYGSVPLKTYLPDGDIDLTALSSPNIEESLARDVLAVLREEEHNENAQFELKDTQFIDAEVKLVKCLVENIVIDISFNQLGGLRTLCFLEQVDRLVGKDHLFKRSIILIKAWCYYESRILGAHHGLISTYALETLVLYIFHLFNSSLSGPLSVFYKFLDYFSKFDWETYCISLNGPAHKSSLPNIVVEKPGNGQDELMLSEEFLRNCIEMFSVQSRELEDMRAFPQKHLNIIDPLKENNNLGRSVHRGNYYRICSAFKYGARKLGQILLLPTEKIPHEIKKFFSNTLNRHGHAYGPNLKNDTLLFGVEALYKDDLHSESSSMDLDEDISEMDDIPEVEDNIDLGYRHKVDKCSNELVSSEGFHASGDNQVNGNACQNNDSKSFSLDFREGDAVNGEIDALNPLSDLSGDYDSHIRSLLYGQCCHGYALSAHSPRGPTSPTPRHHFHNKLNSFSRKNSHWVGPSTNGVSSASHVYPASNIPASPHASFGLEENQKSRGTGTFIPIVMQGSCSCSSKGRPSSSQGRGRWDQLHKDMRRKCVLPPPRESDLFVNGRHDVQSTDSTINGNSSKPHNLNINGFSNSYTVELEFGSITTVVHTNIKLNSNGRSSISNVVGSEGQHSKLVLGKNKQRSSSAFRLKNEDEFPPLSA